MSFRDNLRLYREKAGYAQAKDFAAALGIKYTTYIAYEQGREPKYEILCRIAAALNVTTDELLDYSPNKSRENLRYATENGFIAWGEADGTFKVKLSPKLLSVIAFYSKGKKSKSPLILSEKDFDEWITLAKVSFEARKDIKSVLKTLRHEELEQALIELIQSRYEAKRLFDKIEGGAFHASDETTDQ